MKNNITIITPLFNDWHCLDHLINDITNSLGETYDSIHLLVVNDCSTEFPHESFNDSDKVRVEVLDLVTNVGHQRAILIGLCYCFENEIGSDYYIIMDSDGEDDPKYIKGLQDLCGSSDNKAVVFAKRSKRSESLSFKICYRIYKVIFRLLTGESISFGNFSCIPKSILPRVCNDPNFWNHYSSSVIKSQITYYSLPTFRSKRYRGNSKMNLNSLILHGLSSLSVYIESIIIRIFKLTGQMFILLITGLLASLYIKYFTASAIPGWTTIVFGFLFNILITVLFFNLMMILLHLSNRNKQINLPLSFYKTFLKK
jgi:glycosyltransferase involved in cell wall biosynthesis